MASQVAVSLIRAEPSAPLGVATKLLHAVGGVGNALRNSLFALFTVFFYTTVKGLPGSYVGIAAFIGLLMDIAFVPLIGLFSDRASFRSARRAFMISGSVLMGLGFWALFVPPAGLARGGLFAWLIVTGLVTRLGMAMFTIPYFALGAELSTDYRERTAVSGIRGIVILASTLLATSGSFVLFFPNSTSGVDPKLNGAGYAGMAVVFGLVIAVTGIVSVLGTAGGNTDTPARGSSDESASYSAFVTAWRNRSFRLIIASFFLFFVAIVFNSALAIHYVTYYVGIRSSAALSSCQFGFYLGSAVGAVIWMRLARHAEKHLLYGFGAAATAVLVVGSFALIGDGRLLGTGSVRAMVIGHWLGGCLSSVVWFMPPSMIADACDQEELATGQRREASFFALFYLGRQLAVGVASVLSGLLIDWFARFDARTVVQSSATVWRIGFLFGVLPALCLGGAGVLMLRYPLSERRIAIIRTELNSRRLVTG